MTDDEIAPSANIALGNGGHADYYSRRAAANRTCRARYNNVPRIIIRSRAGIIAAHLYDCPVVVRAFYALVEFGVAIFVE